MTTVRGDDVSVMELARGEREDLADMLATLSPEAWETPSLCEGWRVHDVVAHMISYDELGPRELARRFVKGRFHPDRINAVGVEEYRRRTPEQLVALLRKHLTPVGLTAGMGGAIGLTDGLIHHQDIRRPLGLERDVPAERMVPALRTALFAPVVRGVLRVWDVRLVATDLDWSFGRGPEVHGKAEALLMAVAGRRGVASELSGPGQDRLARRLR